MKRLYARFVLLMFSPLLDEIGRRRFNDELVAEIRRLRSGVARVSSIHFR
jgi:hypothetical protein